MIVQAAVSLVLISAAVMLTQSLRNLKHQNFGFEVEGRYMASIDAHQAGYTPAQLDLLYRRSLRSPSADSRRKGRGRRNLCSDERR